jgi:hypothetical protein
MPKENEKKIIAKKNPKLFIKVILGYLLVLLVFFGFMLSAWVIHGFSYKDKEYFTSKSSQPQAITPYIGDDFYESCHRTFFFCSPSDYISSRDGWDTRCYCYKPNVATYLFSPGFVLAESRNSGNYDIAERVRIQYWALQMLYAFIVTSVIIYLVRRKKRK